MSERQPLLETVDCVSFYTDSLDRGIAFYGGALGLRLLWRAKDSCGLGLREGATELVLVERRNPAANFKVASVEKALPAFLAAGGALEYGPFDIDIGRCAVVADPFGNRFCLLDMTKGVYATDADARVTGLQPAPPPNDASV